MAVYTVSVIINGDDQYVLKDATIRQALEDALKTKLDVNLKGEASGLAELDENGKVPTAQLPSYVDDVAEYSDLNGFPTTGETGKIYVDVSTNKTYRWSGTAYVEISPSLALGTTSSTAYRGDYGNAAYKHAVTNKGSAFASGLYKITTNSEGHVTAVVAVTKADITGLGIPAQDTTYESKVASPGGTDVSLVTTGEKSAWNAKTSNTGTITEIKMNGVSKGTSGAVDLGTVLTEHQDISGKADIIHGIYYGECSTGASTQAKTVTIEGITELTPGLCIRVKFTTNQTYNGVPTLNVNGLGAKNIRYISGSNGLRYQWIAGEVLDFVYDGTYWVQVDGGIATTTYYGVTKLYTGAASTSTALALTPAALNNLAQNMIAGVPVYSTSATYDVGDRVRSGYYIYECNTAISTAEDWTAAHWTALPALQVQIDDCVKKSQGTTNAGKFLIVNSSGEVEPVAMSAWQGGNF